MLSDNEGLRVEEVKTCCLCGQAGRVLHPALRDRLFNAPGVWSLLECGHCHLGWLDPRPVAEGMGKLYANYYTHGEETPAPSSSRGQQKFRQKAKKAVLAAQLGYPTSEDSAFWKCVGNLGRYFPLLRDLAMGFVRDLPFVPAGRLLDVGCGSGDFLWAMRARGWRVKGVEPDPEAARLARERYCLEVTTGTLEGAALPAASVDAMTLSNVIEHVPDPVALLRECGRVLRPGGKLVVETPNLQSFGHRRFGASWRGLEVPRHFFLFSRRALRACAEKAGLEIASLRTTSRASRLYYMSSDALRRGLPPAQNRYRPGRGVIYKSWVFLACEETLRLLNGKAGEELVLIATRSG
jgi:2-polyprenyl-3-methyl-5-hydroxy-6-metoxy-1,4-benzoquinol methylase